MESHFLKQSSAWRVGKIIGGSLFFGGYLVGIESLIAPFALSITGFYPGIFITLLVWLCTYISSLLYAEACLALPEGANLLSMTEFYLGKATRKAVAFIFLACLIYPNLSAYFSAFGEAASPFFSRIIGLEISPFASALILALLLGVVVYLGVRSAVYLSSVLTLALLASLLLLLYSGGSRIEIKHLVPDYWELSFLAIPLLYAAFGFPALIPTLVTYLERRRKDLIATITLGSLLPLFVLLALAWLFIGLTPENALWSSIEERRPFTRSLAILGEVPWLGSKVLIFTTFALTTTLIGSLAALIDILFDARKTPPALRTGKNRIIWLAAILVPTLISSTFITFETLDRFYYFFGFCQLILSFLPLAMVWVLRFHRSIPSQPFVKGKAILITLFIIIFYFFWFQGLALFQ